MADLNTITLIGRVGKAPEIKVFDSGATLYKFTLASNLYDPKTKEDVTNWFNIETFSKLAEYIQKGNLVAVNGKLKQTSWQDENGGNKSRIFVFADNLQILTPKKEKEKPVTAETIAEEFDGEIVQFNDGGIDITDEEIPF